MFSILGDDKNSARVLRRGLRAHPNDEVLGHLLHLTQERMRYRKANWRSARENLYRGLSSRGATGPGKSHLGLTTPLPSRSQTSRSSTTMPHPRRPQTPKLRVTIPPSGSVPPSPRSPRRGGGHNLAPEDRCPLPRGSSPIKVRRQARQRVTDFHGERGWASPVNDAKSKTLAAEQANHILNGSSGTNEQTSNDKCPASMGGGHNWGDPAMDDGAVACGRCHVTRSAR